MPLFRWLLALLRASRGQRLNRDVIGAALELEFPRDMAEQQIDIAVTWDRYAELLAYDDADEMFYLELEPA